MKHCISCKKEISIEAAFCPCCGLEQTDESAVASASEVAKATPPAFEKTAKRGLRITSIIRNSAILALAVLLLVGSFFPISRLSASEIAENTNTNDFKYSDVTLGLNTFQYITLFFDSFKDAEGPDELSQKLYAEIEDLAENLEDMPYDIESEALTAKEKRMVSRLLYLTMRAFTQLDTKGPSVSLVLCAVFGILNILVSVALFVLSLLNLLATFDLLSRGKAQLYRWTAALTTASPAVILACHRVGHLCVGGALSSMAQCSLICVGAVVVLCMILRYIFSKKDTTRNIVARSVALALSLAVFCLTFAPVFSASLEIPYRYTEVKITHKADFFERLRASEEDKELFDSLIEKSAAAKKNYLQDKLSDSFGGMSKKEIQSDYGAKLNADLLFELLGMRLVLPALTLFSLTTLFFILTAVGALLILWQGLYFFVTGRQITRVVSIAKIGSATVAGVALIMTVVFLIMASSFTYTYITSDYSLGICAGVILMTVFAVGSLFCPARLTKKERKMRIRRTVSSYEDFEAQF